MKKASDDILPENIFKSHNIEVQYTNLGGFSL